MKMQKTDIGVVGFMYAVCAFFYVYLQELPEDSQTYPLFTIALLFGLTTLYLITMLVKAKKYGTEAGTGMFKDFVPSQFFFCLAMVILYLLGIRFLGFFTSTTVFMVVVMLFLKVKWQHLLIAVVAMDAILYLAFVVFLKVPLPKGILI